MLLLTPFINVNWKPDHFVYYYLYLYSNNLLTLLFRFVFIIVDPRAKTFPIMDNPLPTFALVIAYLAWVLVIGPIYMRDRKPMQLRNTLILYNAGQVLLSAYMFYEVRLKMQPVIVYFYFYILQIKILVIQLESEFNCRLFCFQF